MFPARLISRTKQPISGARVVSLRSRLYGRRIHLCGENFGKRQEVGKKTMDNEVSREAKEVHQPAACW
jgi:hypothetical protein